MMLTIWIICWVSIISCHEVYESSDETYSTHNTTTLYPTNKTIDNLRAQSNKTEAKRDKFKPNTNEKEIEDQNSDENEKFEDSAPKKHNASTWKLDATFALPKNFENLDFDKKDSGEKTAEEKPASKVAGKEFKPSPHLGSFFDDENLSLLKFTHPKRIIAAEKKPNPDFISSKDLYMLNYKSPQHDYRDQIDAPYKFEDTYFPKTNFWKQTLDSKPTVESPVKIPAGGLYKHSVSFKEKPSSDGDDEDFGLAFNEDGKEKENPVRKRSNPWKKFLHLVTAFLPVGLIISALTPSVITIHSTNDDPRLNRFSRRSDGGFADVPTISERCKRRLLCEIHSEENYLRSQDTPSRYARKHCYKLRCEDPQALKKVLQWLLAHQPSSTQHQPGPTYHPPGPNYQPGPSHQVQYRDQYSSDIMQYHHRSLLSLKKAIL